jgi:hypothetical protein
MAKFRIGRAGNSGDPTDSTSKDDAEMIDGTGSSDNADSGSSLELFLDRTPWLIELDRERF